MEKCVHLLIEYLVSNRNIHSLLTLAQQWHKITKNITITHVNQQQKNQLFDNILEKFFQTATNYLNQINQIQAKSKLFGDFFANLYEFYKCCETDIKPLHSQAFSTLMILCYKTINNNIQSNNVVEMQQVLDYCAKKLHEKNQAIAELKNTNRLTIQINANN